MTSTTNLRVLVVDDVALARRRLVRLLADHADVEVVGEACDGTNMLDAVGRLRPSLVLLDISMPEQDGFAALAEIAPEDRPLVLFTTAHAQYALRAFRVDAVDYLLKPVEPELLAEALTRARERIARRSLEASPAESATPEAPVPRPKRLTLRTDDGLRVVAVEAIDRLEAVRNYVAVHCEGEALIVRTTLQGLLAQLDPDVFLRVHRSSVVNVNRIRGVKPMTNGDQRLLLADGSELPVSRSYREMLLRALAH